MAIQYRSPHIYRNIFKYQGSTPQLSMRAHIFIVPVDTYDGQAIYDTLDMRYDHYYGDITSASFTARARVSHPQTLSVKGRISSKSNQTFTMRAWVIAIQRLTLRARILKHQGWPVPDPSDFYNLWQDTRLDVRARLTNYIAFPTQTFRMKGRVTYGKTLSLQSQARIVTASFMSMRAHILPKFFTIHVPMRFSVRRTSQTRLRVVFCTQGNSQSRSMSLKARIVGVYASRMTGHFIVASPVIFNSVLSVSNPITLARTQQLLSTRARIVK